MTQITAADLDNAKSDVDTIANIANSTSTSVTDRLGNTRRTLYSLANEFPNASDNAAAAAADRVQTGLDVIASEAARDAALLSRGVFATTAKALSKGVVSLTSLVGGTGGTNGTFALAFSGGAGSGAAGVFTVAGGIVVSTNITSSGDSYTSAPTVSFTASSGLTGASATAVIEANVNSGEYFSVPSANDITVYLNSAGTATAILSYKSSGYFDGILDTQYVTPGYAWTVYDSTGKSAIGIKEDGTFVINSAEIANVQFAAIASGSFSTPQSTLADSANQIGYAYTLIDSVGNAAIGIKEDGTFVAKDLLATNITLSTINGQAYTPSTVARNGGRFTHQINFINNSGQSLAEGSSPATTITSTQEYDNIGFPAHSSSPSSFVALTVANTQVSGRGESPMYGTAGHIKALISSENGLAYTINDYQILSCNNGYGGYTLAQLAKGTAPYAAAISQVQAGYNLAVAAGKTFCHQANTWTQGESESTTLADYRTRFIQYAKDYNTDSKAITGQFNDVITISRQVTSSNRVIALAQLEASELCPLIVIACPMYQFDYYDSAHIGATAAKILGGYYGLVYKRVIIDGLKWQPLKPISHSISGNTIDLFFNKEGLTLDTTLVPSQANSGFTVRDAGDATITVSSVAVISPNRVRITCATTPTVGCTVHYGREAATGKGPYVGGCGNLRDNQGDSIVYLSNPMHNWCVLFAYTL